MSHENEDRGGGPGSVIVAEDGSVSEWSCPFGPEQVDTSVRRLAAVANLNSAHSSLRSARGRLRRLAEARASKVEK